MPTYARSGKRRQANGTVPVPVVAMLLTVSGPCANLPNGVAPPVPVGVRQHHSGVGGGGGDLHGRTRLGQCRTGPPAMSPTEFTGLLRRFGIPGCRGGNGYPAVDCCGCCGVHPTRRAGSIGNIGCRHRPLGAFRLGAPDADILYGRNVAGGRGRRYLGAGRSPPCRGCLYGCNTLGAVAGASVGTFVLLPQLGTQTTLWSACLLNAGLAACALGLSRRYGASSARGKQEAARAA